MKNIIIFMHIYFVSSFALECGIRNMFDNTVKKAVSMCSSKNIQKNAESSDNLAPRQDEGQNITNITSQKVMNNTSDNSTTVMNSRSKINESTTSTNQPEVTSAEPTTTESFPQDEHCMLQCILSRMNLTNEEGYPDREKFLSILTKKAKGRELKDFLKDTTENCFRKLKEDPMKQSCDSSVELLRCLADEGKSNCGDWPAGEISLLD